MRIKVDFSAGTSFEQACQDCIEFMRALPVVTSMRFDANGVDCTVYPSTDPFRFSDSVQHAILSKRTVVIDTQIL